jgi:hypothetical protein
VRAEGPFLKTSAKSQTNKQACGDVVVLMVWTIWQSAWEAPSHPKQQLNNKPLVAFMHFPTLCFYYIYISNYNV